MTERFNALRERRNERRRQRDLDRMNNANTRQELTEGQMDWHRQLNDLNTNRFNIPANLQRQMDAPPPVVRSDNNSRFFSGSVGHIRGTPVFISDDPLETREDMPSPLGDHVRRVAEAFNEEEEGIVLDQLSMQPDRVLTHEMLQDMAEVIEGEGDPYANRDISIGAQHAYQRMIINQMSEGTFGNPEGDERPVGVSQLTYDEVFRNATDEGRRQIMSPRNHGRTMANKVQQFWRELYEKVSGNKKKNINHRPDFINEVQE